MPCSALTARSAAWFSSGCSSIWLTAGVTNDRSMMFDRCSSWKLATPIDRVCPSSRDRHQAAPAVDVLTVLAGGPVDQVEVDVIQAEPLQAGLAGVLRRLEALVVGGQLGGDEQLVARDARRGDRAADRGLVAVGRRGVDQPVARLQRRGHRAARSRRPTARRRRGRCTGIVLSSLRVTVGIAAADVMSPTL